MTHTQRHRLTTIMLVGIGAVLSHAPTLFAGEIIAWGRNEHGECNVPPGDYYVAIDAGLDWSLALRDDGALIAWGNNALGPINTPSGYNYTAISAGTAFGLALRENGSIAAWGFNGSGQCNVPSGYDYVAISGGSGHALALKDNGSIVGWGDNSAGQISIPPGTDYVAIAAGEYHSLALKTDGSIVAWGSNTYGQCNEPSGTDFEIVDSNNSLHSLAIRTDGTIEAWGWDLMGQVRGAPSGGGPWLDISGGCYHSLSLHGNGWVLGWGCLDFNYGQCASQHDEDFVAVAAGCYHSLALVEDPCSDPTADAGTDEELCPGGTLVLDGDAWGGSGGTCPGDYSPLWTGPGIVSGANTWTPMVNATGTYTLTVSCDTCVDMDTVEVAASNPPTVDAGATLAMPCDGGTLLLSGTATGGSGAPDVRWVASDGGNILSGDTTLTPTVDAPGTYTFSGECAPGCVASDNTVVIERLLGDIDGDGDVDLDDSATLTDNLNGPGGGSACPCCDMDGDSDTDLLDFADLQTGFGESLDLEGACCHTDASCTEGTEPACVAAGGAYHGDGDVCAMLECPTVGIYSNEVSPVSSFQNPGAGLAIADDITLTGDGRRLTGYDLAVYGGSGGAFNVTVSLYTDCPGDGGTLIGGTTLTWNGVPDDGYFYTLTGDLSAAPVTIPQTSWMVVTFSTNEAGWIVAGEAETGFTADYFGLDQPPWACGVSFVGELYAGFWANLTCDQ
ncbi:MAG: hypothetical protein GY842_00790 [bacterium]|nr:hypothetical protein [bacterium]